MAYTPTNWQTGDVVTASKLNKLENAVDALDTSVTTNTGDITDLKSEISETTQDFNGEIFGASAAVTERVDGGTWLKNQLWCNLVCATVGYYYNSSDNILRLYGLACADQPEGGYSVNWRIAWKDNPDPPTELTIEDEHASTWSGNLDHFKWRLNISDIVHHLDFRTCHVRYDADGNEVDRIYSAQYRYTIENGAVTRTEVTTAKQTASLITDVGLYKAEDSIRRTLNYHTLSNATRLPLVSTEQTVEYQFIIPDSMFEGAQYGLALCVKAGDGSCFYGPTFDKAEDPRFFVTLTPTAADYSGTMDKTVMEINEAYQAGRKIVFRMYTYASVYIDVPVQLVGTDADYTYPSFEAIVIQAGGNIMVSARTDTTDDGTKNTYVTKIYALTPAT